MLRKLSLLFFFCLFMGLNAIAQPPCLGCGEDPDAAIPIDGGVGLLAAAGVAYGVSVLRKKKTTAE